MSEHIQDLDRLDAEAQWHVARVYPEVVAWNERLVRDYSPEPGSGLAKDDQVVPGMWISQIARLSLATGSLHLLDAMRHLNEFGPSLWSLQSLLRTAVWGGAQAVWLLNPNDSETRVANAKRVHYYSQDNNRMWLNTFDGSADTTSDPDSLNRAKAEVAETLKTLGKQPKINQLQIVTDVARLVFADQPEAAVECERGWRAMGAVAHALPWELGTRSTSEALSRTADTRTQHTTARWAEAAADLGFAHEFLGRGWRLLDARSVVPSLAAD